MKRTPLHYAVQHGNQRCVTALFDATAAEQRADQKARINFNIKMNVNAEDAAVSFMFPEFLLWSLHSTAPRSLSRQRRNLRDAPSKGRKHPRGGRHRSNTDALGLHRSAVGRRRVAVE
jgi:hypothetical protein